MAGPQEAVASYAVITADWPFALHQISKRIAKLCKATEESGWRPLRLMPIRTLYKSRHHSSPAKLAKLATQGVLTQPPPIACVHKVRLSDSQYEPAGHGQPASASHGSGCTLRSPSAAASGGVSNSALKATSRTFRPPV
jgi:hypothetical protein